MTLDYIAECDRCGVIERGDLEDVGDAVEDHEQFHDVQVQRVATDGGNKSSGMERFHAMGASNLYHHTCDETEKATMAGPDTNGRLRCLECGAFCETHDGETHVEPFPIPFHGRQPLADTEREPQIRTDGGVSQTENSSGNEGGSVSDLVPEEFDLHDALYKQKSTTPPSKRPRCPECGKLTVRTKTGKPTGRIKVESEYRCGQCLAHFDEPVYGDPSDLGGESP